MGGKKEKKSPTNKQLKSFWQLLDGSPPLTLFPFDLILSKVGPCKCSISARRTCFFFFYIATVRGKKTPTTQKHKCWLDLPLQRFYSVIISEFRVLGFQQKNRIFFVFFFSSTPPSANETPARNSLMAAIMTWWLAATWWWLSLLWLRQRHNVTSHKLA